MVRLTRELECKFADLLSHYQELLEKKEKITPKEYFAKYCKDYKKYAANILPELEMVYKLVSASMRSPTRELSVKELAAAKKHVWKRITKELGW